MIVPNLNYVLAIQIQHYILYNLLTQTSNEHTLRLQALFYFLFQWYISPLNSPVLHSARHQRPARERHKIRIASRENVDNQVPRNTNFTH